MSIEFVVEDGTGLSTATSYLSVADFRQFWENRGKDYSLAKGYTDAKIQASLNNATSWLGYSFRWKGEIINEEQALDFPRKPLWDKNDRDVSDSVPKEIAYATAYLGEYEIKGKSLNEVQVAGLRSKTMGPVTLTFTDAINAGSVQIRSACGLIYDYVKESKVRRGL